MNYFAELLLTLLPHILTFKLNLMDYSIIIYHWISEHPKLVRFGFYVIRQIALFIYKRRKENRLK